MPVRLQPLSSAALLASAALTVMSSAALAPALPALRAHFPELGGSVRLVVTMPSLAIAVAAPLAGRLVDRIGAGPLLVASTALYATAGASALFLDALWAILLSRLWIGAAAAGAMTSSSTLAAALLDEAERARFFGRQASVMSLAGVVSVALGGLLASRHWRAPFVLYLAAVPVFLIALRFVPFGAAPPAKAPEEQTDRSWRRLPIYASTIVAMIFVFIVPLEVPFLLVRRNASVAGFAVAMTTLFAAVSSLWVVRARAASPGVWLARSFGAMGVGYLIVGLGDGLVVRLIGLAVAGAGSGLIMPRVSQWLLSTTSAHSRSKSIGMLTSCVYAGQFLSPFLQLSSSTLSTAHRFGLAGATLVFLALVIHLTRAALRMPTKP